MFEALSRIRMYKLDKQNIFSVVEEQQKQQRKKILLNNILNLELHILSTKLHWCFDQVTITTIITYIQI